MATYDVTAPASAPPIDPWRSIWTQPRATIRWIVAHDPRRHVLPLAIIGGIAHSFDNAVSRDVGESLPLSAILTLVIVVGGLTGIFLVWLLAFLLRITNFVFRGRASGEALQAAIAWSNVPIAWGLAGWTVFVAVTGNAIFEPLTDDTSVGFSIALAAMSVANLALVVYAFRLLVTCVSEVQEYSVWRALAHVLLVPIGALLLLLAALHPAVSPFR